MKMVLYISALWYTSASVGPLGWIGDVTATSMHLVLIQLQIWLSVVVRVLHLAVCTFCPLPPLPLKMPPEELDDDTTSCVAGGCVCCIYGCDSNLSICYKGQGEMCCLSGEACLAKDERMLGPGMITDLSKGECCKIGCFCCSFGFKMPNSVCNGWSRCLCCFDAYSFPYGENMYLSKCHCTV